MNEFGEFSESLKRSTVSPPAKHVSASCAKCWMDFEDEQSLERHAEIEHPSVYARPPHWRTEGNIPPECPTLTRRREAA